MCDDCCVSSIKISISAIVDSRLAHSLDRIDKSGHLLVDVDSIRVVPSVQSADQVVELRN
jgi:hypothetical protein